MSDTFMLDITSADAIGNVLPCKELVSQRTPIEAEHAWDAKCQLPRKGPELSHQFDDDHNEPDLPGGWLLERLGHRFSDIGHEVGNGHAGGGGGGDNDDPGGPDSDDEPNADGDDSRLPRIQVHERQVLDQTADAQRALLAKNDPPTIFLWEGRLARLIVPADLGRPQLQNMTPGVLSKCLARAANWFNGKTATAPPREVVRDFLSLPAWPGFPILNAITEIPVFTPDVRLADTPGYDATAHVWYQSNAEPLQRFARRLRCSSPLGRRARSRFSVAIQLRSQGGHEFIHCLSGREPSIAHSGSSKSEASA